VTAREPLLSKRVLITYADTDAAGIIYYAAWFPWMERVQTEWLNQHEVRFPELLDRCGASVVTRATSCEYLAVVRPYDEIDIAMSIGHVRRRSYRMDFVMTRVSDGVQVASASMSLVGIDPVGAVAALPTLIADLFNPVPVFDAPREVSE
jgi:acyl-CoA thioester hydrolase